MLHPWFASIRQERDSNVTRDRASSAIYDHSPQSLIRQFAAFDNPAEGSHFTLGTMGSDDEEKTEDTGPELSSPYFFPSRSSVTPSEPQTPQTPQAPQTPPASTSRFSVMDVLADRKENGNKSILSGPILLPGGHASIPDSRTTSQADSKSASPVNDESAPSLGRDNVSKSRVAEAEHFSSAIVVPTPRRKHHTHIHIESSMAEKLASAFTEATIPAHLRQGSIDVSVDVVAAVAVGISMDPSLSRAGGFVDVDAVVNAVALLEEQVAFHPNGWEDSPRTGQENLVPPLANQKSHVVDADDLPSRQLSPPPDEVVDADVRSPSRVKDHFPFNRIER